MVEFGSEKIWTKLGLSRREFLRTFGIATGALTLSPTFIKRWGSLLATANTVKVFKVLNGDSFQNTAKIWEMLDITKYIGSTDVVVIKGNAQWPNQGYTHTGCIKGVIDKILELPNFSGEVLICDNVQNLGAPEKYGFDATVDRRQHNWPDHNWNSLAADYQSRGKPVATKRWLNSETDISNPADGEGWMRNFFSFHDVNAYFSYPVFESPLTSGRMIDMKNGVWENGAYTGRKVNAIFMPTLNNHDTKGGEDYAGVTSAIKSFFGATEIHYGQDKTFRDAQNIHRTSYGRSHAEYAGEMVARFIQTMYAPVLYITAAMWSGHYSRTGDATETKTVLACENPATLDYIACRDVISRYAPFLNPVLNNNTRKGILGCISGGVGTIDPTQYEVVTYDFSNPTTNRLDVDRKIKKFKDGEATEQEVKDVINQYMETE